MTYRDQLQLLDYFNANHRLKDTIKGIIQMLLEHYCVWGNNHLASKPVLVFDYCHSSDFLLTSSLDLPVCNFVQFPCVYWGKIAEEEEKPGVQNNDIAASPPLFQTGKPKHPQPLLTEHAFHPI